MNGVEALRFAFNDANQILEGVMNDVTQEMADFIPLNLANPIGYTYFHLASGNDWTLNKIFKQQPTIWEASGWSERLNIEMPEGQEPPREWIESVKVPLDLACEYSAAVNAAVNAYLDTLTDADLDRAAPDTGTSYDTIGKLFAVFITWHVITHTGEIAALKGIQNKIGYGF
ncbi:MAG: DinB family protein [Anaerolineae bacterium]|nr:DinB family protein [Anaerolineae bacterium]